MPKTTKVPSAFPVELELHDDGSLILVDVQGLRYSVSRKDGSPLTKTDIDFIVIERLSYWSIHKKFRLTSVV